MDTAAPTRRKRFIRAELPESMVLTPRDIRLLDHIARHRFLSAAHLVALDGGSAQNVLRSLRVLFDHGYVDRPRSQLANVSFDRPRPMVYGVANRGARLLREHGRHVRDDVDWAEKNKRSGAIFIAHTLEVADFLVRTELVCRQHGSVELVREHEIIARAPAATRTARERLRWTVDDTSNGRRETLSVVPDGMFALRFDDETEATFLLEIDRGTIPITRRADDHRSILRKLKAYYEGWRKGRQLELFGIDKLQVAIVTNSLQRVEHMLDALDVITAGRGSRFFLFADRNRLANSDPLAAQWTNGKRESVRLVD